MTDEQIVEQYTPEERETLAQMIGDTRLYDKLISSIAPTVYGLLLFLSMEKCKRSDVQTIGDRSFGGETWDLAADVGRRA